MAMDEQFLFGVAADAVLVSHALLVAFVVLALPAVCLGYFRRWSWVRSLWFRLAHLAAITIVVLQAWAGVLCPLTVWEADLRALAGEAGREGSFVRYWLQELIFYEAPEWVFVTAYTAFGLVVVLTWFIVPPRR